MTTSIAKIRDDFKMGSHAFWKFSKSRVRKDDSDEEEDNNGVKLIKNRK